MSSFEERPKFVDSTTGAFRWPGPPFAAYGSYGPLLDPISCQMEGLNGMVRACQLVDLESHTRQAYIVIPPARTTMPIKFGQFRRLRLQRHLKPLAVVGDDEEAEFAAILRHRPVMDFQMLLTSGEELRGQTVGYVETEWGLFLYPPSNDDGEVTLEFLPRDAYSGVRFGGHIGQILVDQHAVTEAQIEHAANEQQRLRMRKLGDYLVTEQIVTPEELVRALEQQSRMQMVRIGEALTALGLITQAQLDQALETQKHERDMPLGELMVRMGMLTRQDLHQALARKMGYPVVDVRHFPVEVQALRKVPVALARRLNILPLLQRAGALVIATEDPSNRHMVDELEFALQMKVAPALATAAQIAQAIETVYDKYGLDGGGAALARGETLGESLDEPVPSARGLLETLEQQEAEGASETERPIEQSDNSLVKLINTMIMDAASQGASDIHIETQPGKRKVRIRFRRDGVLSLYLELPPTYRTALVSRLKIMSDLDISERRKPQDGKIDFSRYAKHVKLELRVATIPTNGGLEDVVLRLLASAKPIGMDQLGLSEDNMARLVKVIERPYGMVLCVGPTGSGKTTTLHSVLGHINTPERKIWTAEDPVEITQPDLRQVQVNPKIDWTFAKALRAFLRADPDVIMVGEIRDQETAHTAIEASLTGHLVLSTLHTNSAPETVTRLLDMGMDPFNFADSLLAVLAQRLVRRLCQACTRAEPMSAAQLEEILEDYLYAYPPDQRPDRDALIADWTRRFGRDGRLMHHHASGCPVCEGKGLRGRVGVHELMTVTPALRRLIQTKADPAAIQRLALAEAGMRTLRQDGLEKVLAGISSLEEVRAGTNG